MRRCTRGRRGPVLLAALIGAATLAGLPQARGQEIEFFHSYVQAGQASGITVVFNRENLLPFSPLVDVGVPRVRLEIGDTPTTSARAAPLDPGLVGAATGLAQILGVPPGVVPQYPLYADAKFPTGPEQATVGVSQDLPSGPATAVGVRGHSEAAAERATATASLTELAGGSEGLAGLVTVQGAATDGELVHDGRSIEGVLRARLTGVKLLGGLVEIGTIESKVQLRMPDPLKAPEVASTTTTIGDIRIAGSPLPSGSPSQLADAVERVNEVLEPSGLWLEAAVPTEADGVLGITGVRVTFDGEVQPGERDFLQVSLGSASLSYFSELLEVPLPPPAPPTDAAAGGGMGSFEATSPGRSTSDTPAFSPAELGAPDVETGTAENAASPSPVVRDNTPAVALGPVDVERMAAAVGRITAALSIGGLVVAGLLIAGRFGFIFPGAGFTGIALRRGVENQV